MANNKVQLADGSVLIDLTDTTAVAADVAAGKYFYGADGIKYIGTAVITEPTVKIMFEQDSDGYIIMSEQETIPSAVGVRF